MSCRPIQLRGLGRQRKKMPTVIAFSSSCSMLPIITANSIAHSFCQLIAIKHTFNYFNKGLICSAQKKGHCAVPEHTAAWPFRAEIKQGISPGSESGYKYIIIRWTFETFIFMLVIHCSASIYFPAVRKSCKGMSDSSSIVISIIPPSELPPHLFLPLITPLHPCKVALILPSGKSMQLATLQHPEIRSRSWHYSSLGCKPLTSVACVSTKKKGWEGRGTQ